MGRSGRIPRLLCIGKEPSVLRTQTAVFSKHGYPWRTACSTLDLERALGEQAFEIAILNHTLSQADRARYVALIKESCPAALVMVLHASGGLENPAVDASVDSRKGPAVVLETLALLRQMIEVRRHSHPEFQTEYAVSVDENRYYTFATPGVSRLLGYSRAEIIGRQIEDIVYPRSADVEALFREFVDSGALQGRVLLRHRSGSPIPIEYVSTVYPDGCLIAQWQPVELATVA